jgi:hypothetical protein
MTVVPPPQLSVECVAAKHGIYFPMADICFSFEDLSDDFSIANVKVAAYVMKLFDNLRPNVWNGLGYSCCIKWEDKCVAVCLVVWRMRMASSPRATI